MKHFLPVLVCLSLLSSCITEVEFEPEEVAPQLVVNAVAMVGEPLSVSVTKSVAVFSTTDSTMPAPISDALVMLTANGHSEQLTYDAAEGVYRSQTVVHYADSLGLQVVAGNQTATSFIRVINYGVVIEQIQFVPDEQTDYYRYEPLEDKDDSIPVAWAMDAEVGITLTDPSYFHNYYMASVTAYLYHEPVNDTIIRWFRWEDRINNEAFQDRYIMDDGIYNGKTISLSQAYSFRCGIDDSRQPLHIDSMSVEYSLYSIDSRLYRYLQSAYSNRQISGFMSFFAEPVQVYTNMNGGMGVFGSATKNVVRRRIF